MHEREQYVNKSKASESALRNVTLGSSRQQRLLALAGAKHDLPGSSSTSSAEDEEDKHQQEQAALHHRLVTLRHQIHLVDVEIVKRRESSTKALPRAGPRAQHFL